MLHALPFQGYLNHGFFNYQPCLFRDIAAANDYRMIGIYINIDANTGDVSTYSDTLMNHLNLVSNSTMALFVILQKTSDKEFNVPYDRKYFGATPSKDQYQFRKVPTKFFIPEPFEIVRYIRARVLLKIVISRVYSKLAFWRH